MFNLKPRQPFKSHAIGAGEAGRSLGTGRRYTATVKLSSFRVTGR
jgi:hypothetical protein